MYDRKWTYYVGIECEETLSERDILLLTWVWWSTEVFKRRPDNISRICPDECIADFLAVNWAWEDV
jgi:hypothetical protein